MLHNLELHLLRVCKILVEKLTITQPPRKFPAWYGTRSFISLCIETSLDGILSQFNPFLVCLTISLIWVI